MSILKSKGSKSIVKRGRWTILNVEEDLIQYVIEYADTNGYTIATALKTLIKKK